MPRKSHDPLADHLARGRIDMAQFKAGQEFRRLFDLADKRRPEGPGSLAADQLVAWKALAICYRALGADGSALINDALIDRKTTRQITESRGKTGPQWEKFFSMRLRECLATLASVYGFSNVEKKIRASGAKTQNIGAQ